MSRVTRNVWGWGPADLGQRPLLASPLARAWLPREIAGLRRAELLFAGLVLLAFGLWLAVDALPNLSESACLARHHKADCHQLAYRLKKASQYLGEPLHTLIALLLLPIARGSWLCRVTGLSFDKLVKWHRWLGRAVVVVTCFHAAGFLLEWSLKGTLIKKLSKPKKLAGAVAGVVLLALHVSTLDSFRRARYRLFWLMHVALVPTLFVVLLLHYDWDGLLGRCAVPLALLGYDKYVRWRRTFRAARWKVTAVKMLGHSTARLDLEARSSSFGSNGHTDAPVPEGPVCEWLYLVVPVLGRFEAHPFSVCNMDLGKPSAAGSASGHVTLYVKASPGPRDTWSKRLVRLAASRPDQLLEDAVLVDAPHGGLHLAFPLEKYCTALVFACGIGITALLPAVRYLAEHPGRIPNTTFIWAVRDRDLVHEFAPALEVFSKNSKITVHVFVTCTVPEDELEEMRQAVGMEVFCRAMERPDLDALAHAALQGQELHEPGLGSDEKDALSISKPSLVAGLVCGPQEATHAFQDAVVRFERASTCKVHIHEETFSF